MTHTTRLGNSGRSVAIALVLVAAMVVLAPPAAALWWLHQRYDKALADAGDQLARYRRIIATRDESERALVALKAKQLERLYLKSSTPAAAASEIQDMIRGFVETGGGRLVSTNVPPHKDDGRYRQVNINVQITANGPALRRILHAIDTATPHLLLENINIRQSIGPGYKPVPGVEPDLFVQFDVHGFSLVPVP